MELWIEVVVVIIINLNKELLFDFFIEYLILLLDSGYGILKEDVWSENIDFENMVKSKLFLSFCLLIKIVFLVILEDV